MSFSTIYLSLKTLHVIAMVAWMAGLFYLPRLYVYHADAALGSELDKTFQTMERRLLAIIMNPAGFITVLTGMALAALGEFWPMGWLHVKLLGVFVMVGFHFWLMLVRFDFAHGRNRHSAKFFRMMNELPTLLLIVIVIMVIAKPF